MHRRNNWQDAIGNDNTVNNALDYQIIITITIIERGLLQWH